MKNYSLKNYKLIEEFNFNLNKINIILGENSSGKSSVLRSIQLLKQSRNTSFQELNFNSKKGLDFGSYCNLLPNGEEKEIEFGIEFENKIKSYGSYFIRKVEWSYLNKELNKINIYISKGMEKQIIKLQLEISDDKIAKIKLNDKENIKINNIRVKYSNDGFPLISDTKTLLLNGINRDDIAFRFFDIQKITPFLILEKKETKDKKVLDYLFRNKDISLNENLDFFRVKGKSKDDNHFLKLLNTEYEIFKEKEICFMINSFLNEINNKMKTMLNNISYTGAIRALGERYYRIEDDIFQNDNVNNDVSRKLYTLYKKGNLDAFNKFIFEHLKFKIELNMLSSEEKEDIFYSVNIVDENGNKKNLVDVGAGYSQILPILFACFGKEKNPETIIMIEQPELHLHPKMQSDLVDLFLKLSIKNPNLKLLIETHSNAIVDRIGKHIYKGNYNYKDINLYIFNKEEKLKIEKTSYTERGSIKEWPIRFFSAKELEKWS